MKTQTFRRARWALVVGFVLAAGGALMNPESARQKLLQARERTATANEPTRTAAVDDGSTADREPKGSRIPARQVTFRAAVEDVSTESGPAFPSPLPALSQRSVVNRSPAPKLFVEPGNSNSPASDRSADRRSDLESQLAGLRQSIEALSESRQRDQFEKLERATAMLAQLTQAQQLQRLEQQLQQLQSNVPPAPSEATSSSPNQNAQPREQSASEQQASPESNAGEAASTLKSGVVNAQRAADGSEQFSLQIQEAAITEVLEMLGQLAGMNILVGKNVVGTVSANLSDVTVEEALNALLRSRDYTYERDDKFIYVMTTQEADARKKLTRKLVTKVYRPHYISVKDLQALVTPLMTPPPVGKIAITAPSATGIAPNAQDAGGDALSQRDALLVQDYQQVIDEIDALLIELDVPPLQVVIEAMILSVNLTDAMEFGVNFALLNNQNNNLVVSGNGQTLNNSSGFPGVRETIIPPAAEFLANTAGLKYGFIQGDISAFIEALETITDTNTIASPQLRVLNKQKAELHIGDRLSYTTTTQNGTSSTENVNFMDVGTKLLIRPFISPDGLVRLEVHPERSSGQINAQTGLPDTSTTEVTTNVMVRDGTTVVIGGLIEEQITESIQRIPYLGALPYVGNIFRNKSERLDRTELIVLITPRIVTEPDAEIEGDVVTYENQRRADYFRNNLCPINRRNLARIHFEWALEHLAEGELRRAAWHVHLALEQDKNNLEALQLKDQIDEQLRLQRSNWLTPPWNAEQDADVPVVPPPHLGPPASRVIPQLDAGSAAAGPAPGRVVIRGQSPSR